MIPTELLEGAATNIAVMVLTSVRRQQVDWPAGEDKDPEIVKDAVSDTLAELVHGLGYRDAEHDYVHRVALDRLFCTCPDPTVARAAGLLMRGALLFR